MKRAARIALFACAGVLGVVTVALLADKPAPEPSLVHASSQIPSAPPHVAVATPVAQAAPAPRFSQRMGAQFKSAPNYAAFIQDAMQRPAEGGLYYADLAYNHCIEITTFKLNADAALEGSPARRTAAIGGLDRLKRRCKGVQAQFPDMLTFMRAIKLAAARGAPDPLLQAQVVSGKPGSQEKAQRLIEQALATADPYLIGQTFEMHVEQMASTLDPLYADGKYEHVLTRAARAATCELNGICNDSFLTDLPCIAAGECGFSDYRAYLAEGLDPVALDLYHRTRKKLVRMGTAASGSAPASASPPASS